MAIFAVAATLPALSASADNAKFDDVMTSMAAANKAAAASQQRINDLNDQADDAATRYAVAVADARSYERYAKELSHLLQSQQQRIASINRQMQQIDTTRRGVLPLMDNMVQTLAHFVALDLPFLPQERSRRIQDLKDLMSRSDVAVSEKYRILLQDYLIELEYGRTLGAYDGTLGEGKNARKVQFVRIGRVTLMYQTLDGSETGYWNENQKKWVADNDYAQAFRNALEMANQKGTPQLLTVPVPAPVSAHVPAVQGVMPEPQEGQS
ncbi:MAG TPA: DUF3450 domain-containing protein [Gammaproteobacteria bacterium]|nr:DUF3450 domain-containing protein [Gammaproteobacteria bacterium]